MSKKPLVSILLPTFNRSDLLKIAIESVSAQTYSNWELVVVNDQSTDDTADVLKAICARDSRVRVLEGDREGVTGARNKAYESARGEFIALIDDDDIWLPEKLEWQIEVFNKFTEAAVVFTDGIQFSGSEEVRDTLLQRKNSRFRDWIERHKTGMPEVSVGRAYELLVHSNVVTVSTAMIRKTALREIGGPFHDNRLRTGEGYDLWLRLSRQFEVALLDRRTVRYRLNDVGLMGPMEERAYRTRWIDSDVLDLHFDSMPAQYRDAARRRIVDCTRLAGWYFLGNGNRSLARQLFTRSLRYKWLQPKVFAYYMASLVPDKQSALPGDR